jgi:uncharacterized protein YndB with AHSA1/START domain
MEKKTKVNAVDGKQEILITRDFELPVELLFKAYVEADIVEQWMGTKVLKLEAKKHGSYQYETTDPKGNKYGFGGAIHDIVPNSKMIRTFEMEPYGFGVQLELYDFEKLTEDTSRLNMRVIYESIEKRDANLKLPFEYGINMAHSRMEEVLRKIK